MFKIQKTYLSEDRKTIHYEYELSDGVSKYFKKEKFFATYEEDLSEVPESILVIPLLANVLPVSWFAGFDVEVNVLDEEFCNSMQKVKDQFSEYYSIINDKNSQLIVGNYIEKEQDKKKEPARNAMLFSGGLDAYTTYFRHRTENLDLITIRGADISLKDKDQWQDLLRYNKTTSIIAENKKFYISSNFKEFLTFEVEKLLPNLGWWGKIQHGLALTCLVAPLAKKMDYRNLYIGSTRSSQMPFTPWGSMPQTDNLIKWNSTSVIHDGYELTRMNKANFVVEESKKMKIYPPLRVCYNEFKTDLNCNQCEKCCRTSFAIMLSNGNPFLYGLKPDSELYEKILNFMKKGFSTEGVKFYWNEMLNSLNYNHFYFLEDPEKEKMKISHLKKINEQAQNRGVKIRSNSFKLKQEIINRFPKLFNAYLKIRRKF